MVESRQKSIQLIEVGANAGIVIVALLCIVIGIKSYWGRGYSRTHNIPIGTQLNLHGINWGTQPKSIILALSTNCHFCTESAPFYRDLVAKCASEHIRTIAVFPQSAPEAISYLTGEQVKVDEIKEAPLDTIRVAGTPTLILVDGHGKVQAAWIGKLSAEQQNQVFARL